MAVTSVSGQKTLQEIINQSSKSTSDRNTGELGKNDFLNLLVTQLRYQDPLNPADDKEFIGQMAQFSALEQMQNLNQSFSSTKAFSLINKRITASIVDDTTKESREVNGVVSNVKMSQGKVYVVVKGEDIPVESITNVTDSSGSESTNLSAFTGLIGYKTNGAIYDSETGDVIGVSGTVKALQKGLYEDYAVLDGVNVEISEIVTNTPSTDPDFTKNSLDEAKKLGTELNMIVIDRETGKKVPITAKIKDYQIVDGKITVDLQELNVPVESISGISKA